MPGITLLAQLRQHGVKLPVVFLTGKVIATKEHERCVLAPRDALNAYECMAFDQGAVDFISKSRDRQVLVRRLRNVVELSKPRTNVAVEEHLTSGKLVLNTRKRSRACCNQVDVGLTLGEYNIVHLLATNAGFFVTYRTLYDRLRSEGFIAGTGNHGYRANVRSVIKRIRNKFRACTPLSTRSKTILDSGTARVSLSKVAPFSRSATPGGRVRPSTRGRGAGPSFAIASPRLPRAPWAEGPLQGAERSNRRKRRVRVNQKLQGPHASEAHAKTDAWLELSAGD